jgi:hypothetical protein
MVADYETPLAFYWLLESCAAATTEATEGEAAFARAGSRQH